MIAPSSYGALSATSANTIQGRAPWFTSASGANKLGFLINGVEYSQTKGNINENTPKEFDASLKLSDFRPKSLSISDFNVASDYADSDGDAPHATTPFTIGSVRTEWRDGLGIRISDTTKMIGCSRFVMPLKLKIMLNNVQVHSQYGIPKDSAGGSLTKTYQIVSSSSGMCFARPNSMKVYPGRQWMGGSSWTWNADGSYISSTYGGGYSPDFIVVKDNQGNVMDGGFSPNAYRKFPTTGFPGALFQLVMAGSQTDYSYSVSASPSGSVTVDSSGNVKLVRKPNGNVTVKATLRSNSLKQYTYTFNPTSVWILPKSGMYTYYQATNECGSESNLLSRAELTNSPGIYVTNSTWKSDNYYTRAIGGGVFAEWGYTDSSSYPGYPGTDYYWTQDPWSPSRLFYFVVDVRSGFVGRTYFDQRNEVACRG
ncbi:hypothetical protein RCS94_09220 [Orbaceae bacterium ac157xtp]